MKKNNLNKFVVLTIFLLVSACTSEPTQELSSGKQIYEARCSACHGSNLEGRVGPALDTASPAASMPDSYWIQTITKGKGSMPAQRLTDQEVELVIEYIKSEY